MTITATTSPPTPDRLLLVYDGDSGIAAMLLDAVKKAVGREECPLCEILYSPLGKRADWRACEARLGLPIRGVASRSSPCILGDWTHGPAVHSRARP